MKPPDPPVPWEGPAEPPPAPPSPAPSPKIQISIASSTSSEQGNYAAVHEDARPPRKDQKTTPSTMIRKLRSASADPLATGLITVAAILLAVLALFYWTHKHETPPAPRARRARLVMRPVAPALACSLASLALAYSAPARRRPPMTPPTGVASVFQHHSRRALLPLIDGTVFHYETTNEARRKGRHCVPRPPQRRHARRGSSSPPARSASSTPTAA
ncbi:MAG: hypothetical protein R3B70_13015 [Polyangiaceae bacterium]